MTADSFVPDKIAHGFFGRRGGVGTGVFDSLNVSIVAGDDKAAVTENRRRIADEIGASFITCHQFHSAVCHVMDAPPTTILKGDALVTSTPGIALGVLTADCGPVLFYGEGRNGPVIGAAHAGWGGALNGVIESTLDNMAANGADISTVSACIGPCIGPESYEVSMEFRDPFTAEDQTAAQYFERGSAGKLYFDLPGYLHYRLLRAGVGAVTHLARDTAALKDDYFSYRRATKRGEKSYGRQVSVIAIR